MVIRSEDVGCRDFCVQNGNGLCHFKDIGKKEETFGHVRVFSHATVKPGDSMGYHIHENEMEYYYILKGEGMYNDNGEQIPVRAGDVCYNPDGVSHGIVNQSDEPLEMICLVVLK